MTTVDYITVMQTSINKLCKEVSRSQVLEAISEFNQFIDQHEARFSKKEIAFMKDYTKHKRVSDMRGLIKDHKPDLYIIHIIRVSNVLCQKAYDTL